MIGRHNNKQAKAERMSAKRNKVVCIDASHLAYREYFGSGGDANVARRIVSKAAAMSRRDERVHTYLAFDSEEPSFRKAIYPEYKAGRSKNADDKRRIEEALVEARMLAYQAGVHVAYRSGYEADDLIASITRQSRIRGEIVGIISSDKDFFSLLMYEDVFLYDTITSIGHDPHVGTLVKVGKQTNGEDVWRRYGVEPFQWCDFRCMTGDKSDNIKGVAGYGPVKARQVLDIYETLDQMFDDWDLARRGFSEADAVKFDAFRKELPVLRQLFRMVDSLDVLEH